MYSAGDHIQQPNGHVAEAYQPQPQQQQAAVYPTEQQFSNPNNQLNAPEEAIKTTDITTVAEQPNESPASAAPTHLRDTITDRRFTILKIYLFAASVLYGYDTGNVASLQAQLYKAFGHVEVLPWIVLAYGSANISSMPLARKLLGVLPFHVLTVGTYLLVAIGSAVSGSAQSMNAVIAGRAITGVGCAGMYQVGLSWLTTFGRPVDVVRGASLIGMGYSLGILIGPVVGGAFANNQHATWRWALYLNLPLVALLLSIAAFLPPYQVPSSLSTRQRLAQMDWIGFVLHTASIETLCIALTLSGSVWSWNSGSAIAMWVVAGLLWTAYIAQQAFCIFTSREHQAFPVLLLKDRTVALLFGCACAISAGHGIALFYGPVFQSFAKGYDALEAGVRLMPYLAVNIFASMLSGAILPRVGRYNLFFATSGALMLVSSTLLAHDVSRTTSEANILGFQVMLGFGVGLSFQLGLSVANRVLPGQLRYSAALLFQLAQGTMSLWVAVAGCVFENHGFASLQDAVATYEATYGTALNYTTHDIREALAGVDSPLWTDGSPAFEVLAIDAVAKVIIQLFYLSVAGGALCLIGSFFMKWEKLNFHAPPAPKPPKTVEDGSAKV